MTGIWKEKLKWEPEAESDSHFFLETGLYLAFHCTKICEHGFMGMFLQQVSSARDQFREKKFYVAETKVTDIADPYPFFTS